jgi:D-3-phosphoglycerate dehydrogenase / 2-oxoglutarate reductase
LKIYILDAFHSSGVELAKSFAEVVSWPDPRIHDWPEQADAVMVRMTPITGAQLARAKNVKIICKQGVGLDTIDLQAAKAQGVIVSYTPGVNSEAVAEMALALALSVSRRTSRFERLLRAGEPIVRPDHLGLEMWGKTVGVVGMGNIGTRLAKKWHHAFACPILAYDPYAPDNAWADLTHERLPSLHDLLPRVDLLSLHLPLTPESYHLIGREELKLMKRDAMLINVSRGGLIDEDALYEAMQGGHLFGAGLDVFEHAEPPSRDHPLLSLENVVATPHAAGGTLETQIRSATQVAQQVIDVLSGKPPRHVANAL